MKISKYLTLVEATKSDAAIRKGIDNTPNEEQLENMKFAAEHLFDPVRDHVGGPLNANSFFRSPELNAAIGGAKNSQHCKGEAIDMDCDKYGFGSNKQVFEFIRHHLQFDQLIWEFGDMDNPAWVHASVRRDGKNRYDILRAYKTPEGETKYVTFDL